MKTVSRVYDSYGQAREAVRAVEAAGVPSSEVSLIANKLVALTSRTRRNQPSVFHWEKALSPYARQSSPLFG